MKFIGEDWFSVGEMYFRQIHFYDLPWDKGFPVPSSRIAVCQSSGRIALFLDQTGGAESRLYIYTSAGRLVTQIAWKYAPVITFAWTTDEKLLVVQKNGHITYLDDCGKFVSESNMGRAVEETGVVDSKFFIMNKSTEVAVLTENNRIFITISNEVKRLAEFGSLSSWQIVTEPFNETQEANQPWALVGYKRDLIAVTRKWQAKINLSTMNLSAPADIRLLAVSQNMKFVAIYFDNGELWVTNMKFTELHSQVDLTKRVSMMLQSMNKPAESGSKISNHPVQMLWLTTSAVVLQWNHALVLVGAQADIYELFYADDVHISQEIDGIRIITPTSNDLLQRVPSALESLGRIGACCPATWLISACKSLKTHSGRTNDYLLPIRQVDQMIEAIAHCIEAACHSVFDPQTQQELLEAAQMGRVFLSALFTSPDNQAPESKLNELADRIARVCQELRFLNSLAVPWIGIAVTWAQWKSLYPAKLFKRFLDDQHYPLALELVRLCKNSKSYSLTNVLCHWVKHSTTAKSTSVPLIGTSFAGILDKICTHKMLSGNARISHLSENHGLDFSSIADSALQAGRPVAAEVILEYEPRPANQIPILLRLKLYNRALVRAVETGDHDLINTVVTHMHDDAKLPPADLAMILSKYPIAVAAYQETLRQMNETSGLSNSAFSSLTNAALLRFQEEGNRAKVAKKLIASAYKETNFNSRLASLDKAEEIYRQLRNDFMAQECNAAIRLLRFQSKLEKQEVRAPVFEIKASCPTSSNLDSENLIVPSLVTNPEAEKLWIGQSLNTTLARLLASATGDKQANQLRREFRVSEKRYEFLRLIAMAMHNESWAEMNDMTKSKRPLVSIEILVKICIDGNRFEDALKLIPRLPVERRVKYLVLCGKVEEAIRAAVREKSDSDLVYIQQSVGKNNRTMYDRISQLRAQIR